MIAVAIVALVLALAMRARHLQRIAGYYEAKAAESFESGALVVGGAGPPGTQYVISPRQPAAHYMTLPSDPKTHYVNTVGALRQYHRLTPRGEWYLAMWEKYRHAALRPWLPVPPDPPQPK